MNQIKGIGIAWYRNSEDYERIRAISDDAETFPDTFDAWEKRAEEGRKELIKQGFTVVKAYLDPETFPDWCKKADRKVDAKGRMAWGAAESHRVTSNIQQD